MHRLCVRSWALLFAIAAIASLCSAAVVKAASKVIIPETCFDSQADFDKYFGVNYPWGTDHNGAARMDKSQVALVDGTLRHTAKRVNGQKDASHGGKAIKIKYLSGTTYAKEHFTVTKGGGFDFIGEFRATTARGTWPAFWLTAVDGWPPEVDMAEWKGSGKISFNTFNTSSQVAALDVQYPKPDDFHKIRCEIRDENGRDLAIKFFMDDKLVTTQVGKGFLGKAMYL
ncbi:glycoside hydrolase family 16 protein [Thozetella sp. PMI_491]|nr:glycoside hydrolase family 16 protein [Thozetella sp. PMI_491]